MSIQFNRIPQFNQPLEKAGITNKDWYFFFAGLFRGLAPGNEVPVTLTGSPFEYSPPDKGSVIVSGGTVSLIEFSRNGIDYYDVGSVAGMYTLSAADRLRITYTVAPDVTFVPT